MAFLVAHVVHKHCALSSLINDAACLRKLCEKIKSLNCFILKMYASGRVPFMQVLCIAKQFAGHVFSQVVKLIWWICIFHLTPIFLHSTNGPLCEMTLLRQGMIAWWCKVNPSHPQHELNHFQVLLQNMLLHLDLSPPLSPRDLLRIGVTLAGHQKKILSNIQSMRVQMSQSPTTLAWLQGALCHGTGSIRRNNNSGSLRMTPDPSDRARVETIVLI